ncbi:MAG: glycosyltransferase family 4 protein [Gemmatimonadota bacterium]|nr:glycosyltransferase family 4 protein [Gemmatimonadota bacterium]
MSRPLRIAQVSPYGLTRFGGVRSHIQGLGEALVARGHTVTVLAPGADGALGTLPVVGCGAVRPVHFSGTRFDVAWAPWARCRAVLAPGFDVLHLHTLWNPAVPLQLAAHFRGTRVATFHDVPGLDTPRWATMLMPPAAALLRHLLLHATIGVSPAVSAYLGAGTHHVIPNGVGDAPVHDTQTVHGTASSVAPVLYLGRLDARKDVGTLLDAMAGVATQLGDATPPLVIAGDGPLRPTLEAHAARVGLTRVTFLGDVPDAQKWQLLATARCVVAPSRAGESFGIVLLEAMRAGTLPLAADNPGYRHVLDGDGRALCFPAGRADALAALVVRALTDTAWRGAMQRWAAKRWPRFAWSQVAAEVERVYHDALHRRPPRHP